MDIDKRPPLSRQDYYEFLNKNSGPYVIYDGDVLDCRIYFLNAKRPDERSVKLLVLEKLEVNPKFLDSLIKTKGRQIRYKNKSSVWGYPGRNMYGRILMLIREKLLEQ